MVAGLRHSVEIIRELIKAEAEDLGEDYGRIVLAGISQGAAVGVHTLINLVLAGMHDHSPGAIVIDSEGAQGVGLGAFVDFCARLLFSGRKLQDMRDVLQVKEKAHESG